MNSLEWGSMSVIRAELKPHPGESCPAIRHFAIEVDPAALPASLLVLYRIAGDIDRLRLPPAGFARRADGLWQHSCFEAFLRAGPVASYYEFNLAPSGDWAAWRFGRLRSERITPDIPAPRMERRHFPDGYELGARIPIAALPELARAELARAAAPAPRGEPCVELAERFTGQLLGAETRWIVSAVTISAVASARPSMIPTATMAVEWSPPRMPAVDLP